MTDEQLQLGQPAELCHYCRRCHRRLKAERAMRLGYGKVCYAKVCQEARAEKESANRVSVAISRG